MKQFNLAEWALKHKSIIYYFMAVLLTFGIFSFTHMGRMEDPDFTMRTMVVGVAWPGASPQEMSDQVTDKLEEKTTRSSWCRLYKIFYRWQQIRYLYQFKRGFAIR